MVSLIQEVAEQLLVRVFKKFQLACSVLILLLLAPILLLDAIDIVLYVARLIDYCIRHIAYYRRISGYEYDYRIKS